MDEPDRELEDVDDRELGDRLRRHADALTGPVDTDRVLAGVQRRIRRGRRRRVVVTTVAAAAAAAVILVSVGIVTDDSDGTVRTPAASTAGPPTSTPITVPPTTPTPATVPPATVPPATVPSTSAPPVVITSPPDPPASPPPTTPPPPSPTTVTFSSAGGSIVVARSGGAISLVEDPAPSDGWSVRIDDDGPTRVRVRFEGDGRRSEIRVDLRGDELVPEIIEQ